MILKTLREEVLEANLELVRRGLVLYTFGNASGIDRESGLVVIKPSGVPYERMKASDIHVETLEPGSPADVQSALARILVRANDAHAISLCVVSDSQRLVFG